MRETHTEQLLSLVNRVGVLRARELDAHSIPRIYLTRLVQQGILLHVGRSLYMLANAAVTERHSLVEASKRVPNGVICLLSALNFHQLTTQLPFEIWMAIENKAWTVQETNLPLRFVRFSGAAFTEGVAEHIVEEVSIKVYTPAKTVADCFKYRNKIGLDVAIEALRDGVQQHRFAVDELWQMAKICRVQNVIKPYLEAML